MSRYIDEDKVLKIVNDMTECEDDYERITEWVHNMPSIDIVRCKDCKWYKKIVEKSKSGLCHYDLVARCLHDDDYCSHGERREP